MNRIVAFCLLIIYTNIYSQQANPNSAVFIPQGFSLQTLGSSGTSNIINDISKISAVNPASINEFNKISAGISYELQTNIDDAYIAGIGYKHIQNFTPQSFGIIIPINELKLGIGMRQKYNCGMDLGLIPISTTEQPYGTGEFFHPVYVTVIHSYSLIISYSFLDTNKGMNNLSIGIRLDYNRLHQYQDMSSFSIGLISYSPSWEAGFIYTINFNENQKLRFGISYENNIQFREISSAEGALVTEVPTAPGSNQTTPYVSNSFKSDMPEKVKVDLYLDPDPNFKFITAINYILWDNIGNNFYNQFELSGNVVYSPKSILSSSIGFYSTGRKFKPDFYRLNDRMNAFFITAGLKINFSYFNINLAVADSHLLSGDAYKQTIGNIGIGFQL